MNRQKQESLVFQIVYKSSLIILLFLMSCTSKVKEDIQEDFQIEKQYQNGKLQAEFTVVNGIREGLGKCYYSNGKLSSTCNYINGVKQGEEQKFYFDGKLYRTREFVKGELDGIEKRYHTNGQLMTEQTYKDGMPGTDLKEYSPYGKLLSNYPEFEYKVIYDRDYEKQKLLLFYFSDKNKNVSFYKGSLIEDKYFDNHADLCGINDGVGEIGLALDFSDEIEISAKYITSNKAPYIVQQKIFVDDER